MKEVVFTADQLRALDMSRRHEDTCVVAGPGSGKTTVLVEYFARLLEAGVDPLRILAITFTEKAAGNMRAKLAKKFHDDSAARAKLERAWVSTVHGFCARLLRENAIFAGVDPEFAVLDSQQSFRLQKESLAKAIDDLLREHGAAMRALIRGLSSLYFDAAVLNAYDAMRGAGWRVGELATSMPAALRLQDIAGLPGAIRNESTSAWSYQQKENLEDALRGIERIIDAAGPLEALKAIDECPINLTKLKRNLGPYNLVSNFKQNQMEELKYSLITDYYTAERKTLLEIFAQFDREYRARKRALGGLDFADLEEYAVRLLEERPEVRARVREQFDHVLMDEFQDTNGQQAKLMELVRPPDRFYVVGDINQSIFGFRHAEPEGFAHYRDEIESAGKHLVGLRDNFRSRAAVLRAVETITAGADGIDPRALVPRRKFDAPRDCCVEMLVAPNLEIEAQWVARRIGELVKEGFAYRGVAVLVRNTEVIPEFTTAFEDAGIPYVVNQGRGFYGTREVNDLTQLLRVIANPRDEVALAAVLRSPLVGVPDEALLGLKACGDNLGASLMRLGAEQQQWFAGPEFEILCGFRDRLRQWRVRREYVTFDRLLLEAMDDCAYEPASGARGRANIDKFLAQAREASGHVSLDAFIEELALLRESNPKEPDAPPEDGADAVMVMTVHAAKGLEFPVVFLAAMHKGVNDDPDVVAFSRQYGLGARWRSPAGGKDKEKDDVFQHEIRQERKTREKEEGNRVLYVGMTRAEEVLVLSFSGDKLQNWGKTVVESLALDWETPREETLTRSTPDGEDWVLRLAVRDRAPEPPAATGPLIAEREWDTRQELKRPALTEQFESNATVTALAKFASCPREYYLGVYLGYEGRLRKLAEGDGEPDAAEFGTQVHDLLAGKKLDMPDEAAVRQAEVFRQSALGRRVETAARVEREFDFLMSVEGLVIRGQVDLWFEDGAELVIVDYKTDAVTAAQARERAKDYELQLKLYAAAVEKIAGRAVTRACLHFLRPNVVVDVDLAPSLLDAPDQVVQEFVEAQDRMEFPLKEGPRCLRCAFYKDLCPAGLST